MKGCEARIQWQTKFSFERAVPQFTVPDLVDCNGFDPMLWRGDMIAGEDDRTLDARKVGTDE